MANITRPTPAKKKKVKRPTPTPTPKKDTFAGAKGLIKQDTGRRKIFRGK